MNGMAAEIRGEEGGENAGTATATATATSLVTTTTTTTATAAATPARCRGSSQGSAVLRVTRGVLRVLSGYVAVANFAYGQGTATTTAKPAAAAVAPAQGAPPAPKPAQPPKRRALDIRAQAPAPEVVTVRPREIPEFSRALIAPALYSAPEAAATDRNRSTVVIFPGTLPIVPPASRADPRPPEQPDNE